MSNHDRHGQHRYGSLHKKVRRQFVLRMGRGEVFNCWRCGLPITGRGIWAMWIAAAGLRGGGRSIEPATGGGVFFPRSDLGAVVAALEQAREVVA